MTATARAVFPGLDCTRPVPRQRLVKCANLRPIAQAKCLGEAGAAVGTDRRAGLGPADRDIGGGGIGGVRASSG